MGTVKRGRRTIDEQAAVRFSVVLLRQNEYKGALSAHFTLRLPGPDRRFVYTLRKAVFVCFLRERRSARNRSPSLLHLKSGKNVNFSLPIRFERGIINSNRICGFPYSDRLGLRSFTCLGKLPPKMNIRAHLAPFSALATAVT